MNMFYSLIFSLLAMSNFIEISSASSSPREIDLISQLDQRSEASSSHSHSAGEGLSETELRLNTNPQAHSTLQGSSRTQMHIYLDPQMPPDTRPRMPSQYHLQVHSNQQNIPLTMLKLKDTEFYFISGLQYWAPNFYKQGPNGKLLSSKASTATEITAGNHQAVVNGYQEAVGYFHMKDQCSYIGYRGVPVALRWENEKLGVRILEESERNYLITLRASQRRN